MLSRSNTANPSLRKRGGEHHAPSSYDKSKGTLLGGSWVVICRVISPLIWIVTLLMTPLITTHEPPSKLLPRFCRTSHLSRTFTAASVSRFRLFGRRHLPHLWVFWCGGGGGGAWGALRVGPGGCRRRCSTGHGFSASAGVHGWSGVRCCRWVRFEASYTKRITFLRFGSCCSPCKRTLHIRGLGRPRTPVSFFT